MRPHRLSTCCLVLAILAFSAPPSIAQVTDEDDDPSPSALDRPMLRVAPLPPDFVLDGRLSDIAWQADTDSIANLTTIEPEEGRVPTGQTIVRVLADERALVIGVQCFDQDPRGIVSFSKARDSALDEEDHVVLVLDTFLDGRSGYVFAVNPAGARFDGLAANRGEEVNSDWDAIWEAKTTRDDRGWYAEIRIPIASLAFKGGSTTWGFNVQRRVQRLQETDRWAGANIDYEIYQTSRAGRLTDLPPFDLGVGMSVRPAAVGRVTKPGPGRELDSDADISLDVTQRLGGDFLSVLTANTDFSETEVDVRRINLTRFPISFPEKRSFFLDRADLFDFGLGLGEETLVPFFTRRIGLVGPDEDEQTKVPINFGGKVTGRIGRGNLGALVVGTHAEHHLAVGEAGLRLDVPQATMGALRIKQDVLAESSVGLLATFGDQLDRRDSWMGGLDFTYQTSRFQDDKNLLAGVWGLRTDRKDLRGDKTAYGITIDYPNDLWDLNLTSARIGGGFDPSLGFVPRKGSQILDLTAAFAPRPSLPFVRQMFHEVSYTQFINRRTDRWETYEVSLKPIDWLLESGDRFSLTIEPQGDRPPAEFEVAPDIDIAPGSYEWTRNVFTFDLAEKRRISGSLTSETGGYYTGRLRTVSGRLALKPSALLTLELTGERNRATVMSPENESIQLFKKRFTEELLGVRLQLNVSPDLQFSSLTQYDTQSRELGSNNRFQWTFVPDGNIIVVYNHELKRALNQRWHFVSNQLPLKIQYSWRF